MEPLMIVSADGHCGAKLETYRQYLPRRFHDDLDRLKEEDAWRNELTARLIAIPDDALAAIDADGAIASGGVSGAWDVGRRLRELDREGVAAEILFPNQQSALMPFFSVTNRSYPAELRRRGRPRITAGWPTS